MSVSPPLTTELLVYAYCNGLFPMARSRHGPIDWYRPEIRAVLPLDRPRFTRSLIKKVRNGPFTVTFDQCFNRVITACARPRRDGAGTWISDEIINAYTKLHDEGYAHAVEAWLTEKNGETTLVGGLYGISIGGAFFGESMFSAQADASKVCLVHLIDHLNAQGYALLDCQYANPHMEQFGLEEIAHDKYMQRLASALALNVTWESD